MSNPYADQEEVEKLKAWWRTYGTALLLGIVIGVGILYGNKYWQDYKRQRAEAASALYDRLLEDYNKKALADVRKAGTALMEEHRATPYAGLAAILLARVSLDAQQKEEMRRYLKWAVEHASDEGTRHAARLRLGRALVADGEVDTALTLIDIKDTAGFESDYQELRGDVLAAKGRKTEARQAYERALKYLDELSPYRPLLMMKLDDLGPELTQ
jgi:predicted negative regulator of RcsB-dependent stress response